MKLLLDEMYPATLADGLQAAGIGATTLAALKLAGSSDSDVFAAAAAGGYVLLTENVGDFTRLAGERSAAGLHHPGLLIALSYRFSRRPAGARALIAAIQATAQHQLGDGSVYLERPADA